MRRQRLELASGAVAFLLYFVFIVAAAAVLFLGIKAQRSAELASDRAFEERMAMSYVAEKLRQSDGGGAVYTGYFGGESALFLESTYEGVLYTDIIYSCGGELRELFCEKGAHFSPDDGSALARSGSFVFSQSGNELIRIEMTGLDGKKTVLNIFLRSGGEI